MAPTDGRTPIAAISVTNIVTDPDVLTLDNRHLAETCQILVMAVAEHNFHLKEKDKKIS